MFKRAYKHFNKVHLISNWTSTGLIVIGTIGGGGGGGGSGVTQTPIVLGVISGSGLLLKTSTEDKNLMKKIELCRFALTSYEKCFMGGISCDEEIIWINWKSLITSSLICSLLLTSLMINILKNSPLHDFPNIFSN